MKPIYYVADDKIMASGYWDMAMLDDLLSKPIFKNMEDDGGAIFVIPGAYQAKFIKEINEELSKYEWVLLFITSDEESKFPVEEIKHPNIKIWVQYSKQGRHDIYGRLPLGYTTETRKRLTYTDKSLDLFYSGQKSHARRVMCSDALIEFKSKNKNISVTDTFGFSQGLSPAIYMGNMCNARVAPAPAGSVSADSFRAYEALEAGAVPIADQISLAGDHGYWNYLFGSVPFATITDYESLPGYCKDILEDWPRINLEVQAWWIMEKRELMWKFVADIERLSGSKHREMITVLIPVSPIKSHPSTQVLENTIESIRYHFPEAEIIITFDGVRPEQEDRRSDYYESIRKCLYLCNTKWDAIPIIFWNHTHQAGMAKVALEKVKTPMILYVEQDTPLVTDEPIEWEKLKEFIKTGESNVIRFHFEAYIPEEHEYLMIGKPENGLQKTVQWSQRPALSSVAYYKRILADYFSSDAKCFIEDRMYGVILQSYREDGIMGWYQHKIHIYHPMGGNIKRSLNLDGRAGAKKYAETQVF